MCTSECMHVPTPTKPPSWSSVGPGQSADFEINGWILHGPTANSLYILHKRMNCLTVTVSPLPPQQFLNVALDQGCVSFGIYILTCWKRAFKVSTGKRTQGSPTAEAVKGKLIATSLVVQGGVQWITCECNGAVCSFPAEQRALRYTIQVFVCVLVKGKGKEN